MRVRRTVAVSIAAAVLSAPLGYTIAAAIVPPGANDDNSAALPRFPLEPVPVPLRDCPEAQKFFESAQYDAFIDQYYGGRGGIDLADMVFADHCPDVEALQKGVELGLRSGAKAPED